MVELKYITRTLFHLIIVGTGLLNIGCNQQVKALSAADIRLPSAAKQRIADAEDAVLIAQSRFEDAQQMYEKTLEKNSKFNEQPPNLGSATTIAKELNAARVNYTALQANYAEVDLALSESRLQLVYAQTALRYDLAVYDLVPLNQAVTQQRSKLLKLRKEKKQAQANMKEIIDRWWSEYQSLAKSSGTNSFWLHEFVQ